MAINGEMHGSRATNSLAKLYFIYFDWCQKKALIQQDYKLIKRQTIQITNNHQMPSLHSCQILGALEQSVDTVYK